MEAFDSQAFDVFEVPAIIIHQVARVHSFGSGRVEISRSS